MLLKISPKGRGRGKGLTGSGSIPSFYLFEKTFVTIEKGKEKRVLVFVLFFLRVGFFALRDRG